MARAVGANAVVFPIGRGFLRRLYGAHLRTVNRQPKDASAILNGTMNRLKCDLNHHLARVWNRRLAAGCVQAL